MQCHGICCHRGVKTRFSADGHCLFGIVVANEGKCHDILSFRKVDSVIADAVGDGPSLLMVGAECHHGCKFNWVAFAVGHVSEQSIGCRDAAARNGKQRRKKHLIHCVYYKLVIF